MFQKKKLGLLAAAATLALVAAGCGASDDTPTPDPTGTDTPAVDGPDELVLALVPSREDAALTESAKELEDFLTEEIGIPVRAEVTDSYAAAIVALRTNQAHIALLGPVGLAQAADQAGAVPVLQSIRRGVASYHTQWMTNDPETYCLDDVVEDNGLLYCNGTLEASEGPVGEEAIALIEPGTSVSFVSLGSASGYFYPATQWGEITGNDPINELDGHEAGGHDSSVLAVNSGDYPVGVSFDDARTIVLGDNPEVGENVVVFAYSSEIPNDGVVVGGDLPADLQQRITDALLAMSGDGELETDEDGRLTGEGSGGIFTLYRVYEIEGLQAVDLDAVDVARSVANNFGD
ncbi:phosphate/phosphite/phosphonate ABC transporter substrate-binding protein [Nocardioides limicola]|uniref:phosphate/phosphite/phosphonate ABC transporter substrate-binding protein n=1 Tax=Nocardioides limicola TaxID=2803368 RepID=UPI001EF0EAF8|nr:phosphate/phosphite/phosphonate ABC transporter substrate-binding protein [Nocardioides sp. DJM-14]